MRVACATRVIYPPFLCRWKIYKSSEPLRSSKSTPWNSHTPCYSPSLSSRPLPLLRLRLCTAWTPHVSSLSLYTPRPSPKDSRKLSFVATRKPAALYESSLSLPACIPLNFVSVFLFLSMLIGRRSRSHLCSLIQQRPRRWDHQHRHLLVPMHWVQTQLQELCHSNC